MYLAVETALVPLRAHLLAVCLRGVAQARTCQRAVFVGAPLAALPPLGRARLRPGTVGKAGDTRLGWNRIFFYQFPVTSLTTARLLVE